MAADAGKIAFAHATADAGRVRARAVVDPAAARKPASACRQNETPFRQLATLSHREKQVGETAPLRRPARRFHGSVRAGHLNSAGAFIHCLRHSACNESRATTNRYHGACA
jgi:hypothetical protein